MSKRIPIKLILRLLSLSVSCNQIAQNYHISKNSILAVSRIAREKNITYHSRKDSTDLQLYREFFPEKARAFFLYCPVAYATVHQQLANKGVTLKSLWQAYKKRCDRSDALAMGYAKFCRDYHAYVIHHALSDHQVFKPGAVATLAWLDSTFPIQTSSGKTKKAFICMGWLPYSQYLFMEICSDKSAQTFSLCAMHFFASLGGVVSQTIIPKSTQFSVKQTNTLPQAYGALARYYGTSFLTETHYKGVDLVDAMSLIHEKIRNMQTHSFEDMAALRTWCEMFVSSFNVAPLGSLNKNRYEIFLAEEKPQLLQLPLIPYEREKWMYHKKVREDACILYKKNYYSCAPISPGSYVDIKIHNKTLSIYVQGAQKERYTLFSSSVQGRKRRNTYDLQVARETRKEALVQIRQEALSIGPPLVTAIDCIIAHESNMRKAVSAGTSIIRLQNQYGKRRLLCACQYALNKKEIPTYRLLQSILANKRDVKEKTS